MNKIQQRVRILALFSIFFIYKILTSETFEEATIWLMITIVYLISIAIMIVIFKGWKEASDEQRELLQKLREKNR